MSKIKPWFFAMIILLLISFPVVGAETNIKSVSHFPQNPFSGEYITVFVEVNNTSNITNVSLIYCQIEPSFLCYRPLDMILEENNTYIVNITENLEEIIRLGYNITIIYDNGSEENTPIGSHYYYVNITQSQGGVSSPQSIESTSMILVLIIACVIILIFLVVKHVRRKDKTQPMTKKVLGTMIIIVIVIFSVITISVVYTGQISKAPDFTLTDIDDEKFSLSDFDGKVVVLDLMALDCSSCQIVERNLMDINTEYGDEIEIISVSVWPERDSVAALRDHRDVKNITWRIARDTDDVIAKYGATEIAKVVIINSDGYVVFEKVGVSETDEMSEAIDKAISGKAKIISISPMWMGALAFGAGVAAFFSPCSFPLLPGYIGYYLSIEKSRQKLSSSTIRRALPGGLASALGILFIYVLVGTILLTIGRDADLNIAILAPIIGIVLIMLGALMLTNVQYYFIINPLRNLVNKLKTMKKSAQDQSKPSDSLGKKGLGGLFAFGIGYGAASAGCTLPIFGVIVLGALVGGNFLEGVMLFLLYGLGAAIFMIITTLLVATSEDTIINKLKVSTEKIKKLSGVLMIVGGVGVIIFYFIAFRGGG